MDHLNETQLGTLRAMLDSEAGRLNTLLSEAAGEMADTPTPDPRDIEEAAAEEAGSFRATKLRDRERARLREIEAALGRMGDGSYGVCEDSDEDIPYRRLELEPTTRFTVEAQEQREQEAGVLDPHGDEPTGY